MCINKICKNITLISAIFALCFCFVAVANADNMILDFGESTANQSAKSYKSRDFRNPKILRDLSKDSQGLSDSQDSTNSRDSHPKTLQKISVKSKNINVANPKNPAKSVLLSFVGDIILGDYLGAEGATFDAKFAEVQGDFAYFGGGVAEILKNDELSVGNLEGVLSNGDFAPAKEKTFIFKGRESYAKILRLAGIDIVNLANNHSSDYGQKGLERTQNALKRAKVQFFGEENLAVLKLKGIRFGFAGERGFSLWAKEAILRDIERLRKMGAEVVIFTLHFGEEKSHTPSALQRELAHFAIDSGADLVVAHHTHTLQGIEEYKGKKIVYSLANFIYGGSKLGGDKDSMIYQVRFVFGVRVGESDSCEGCANNFIPNLKSIDRLGDSAFAVHNIIPISVSSSESLNDYRPMIYPKYSDGFTRIMQRLSDYSEAIKDLDLRESGETGESGELAESSDS